MAERSRGRRWPARTHGRRPRRPAQARRPRRPARRRATILPTWAGCGRSSRAYQVTHEHDRALPYLLLAAFLLPLAAAVTIGLLSDQVLNLLFVGLGVASCCR